MTTRLDAAGPRSNVHVAQTAQRTTAAPARPFQEIVRASASAIVASAEQAATRLPGGPILAAAVRPMVGAGVSGASAGSSSSPQGGSGSAAVPEGSAGTSGLDGMLANGSADITYYLELQERMNSENRKFTAVSNVLKARHETVKNAITNIR